MTTLLTLVEALARDPEAKAAYAAEPDAYLEHHGFGDLSPDDVNEAVLHASHALPPVMAAQLDLDGGLESVVEVDPDLADQHAAESFEDDLFGQDDRDTDLDAGLDDGHDADDLYLVDDADAPGDLGDVDGTDHGDHGTNGHDGAGGHDDPLAAHDGHTDETASHDTVSDVAAADGVGHDGADDGHVAEPRELAHLHDPHSLDDVEDLAHDTGDGAATAGDATMHDGQDGPHDLDGGHLPDAFGATGELHDPFDQTELPGLGGGLDQQSIDGSPDLTAVTDPHDPASLGDTLDVGATDEVIEPTESDDLHAIDVAGGEFEAAADFADPLDPSLVVDDPFAADTLGESSEPWYEQSAADSYDAEVEEPESDILDDVDDIHVSGDSHVDGG